MSLFDWFGKKKPAGQPRRETEAEAIRRREARRAEVRAGIGRSVFPNEPPHGAGAGGMGSVAAGTVGRRGHGYRTKRGHVAHVDASFDGEEHAAFLLGIKVDCRSSWISAAQWNEETGTLTLSVRKSGKDYPFPGIDFQKATVFSSYNSKGKWYWEQWKGRSGAGEFPLLDQMPLP